MKHLKLERYFWGVTTGAVSGGEGRLGFVPPRISGVLASILFQVVSKEIEHLKLR